MGKVYILVRVDWNSCAERDYEKTLGIFDSEESIAKAADNYIRREADQVEDEFDLQDYIIPDKLLTFEQLRGAGYTYYNFADYEGLTLHAYGPYEMNKLFGDKET